MKTQSTTLRGWSCTSVQHATITLLALLAATGAGVAAQGTRVFCRFKSATQTTIATEEGYAVALINIAEAICPSASGGRPPALDTSFTVVASTIATAVAEVVGQCAGDGNARLTIQTRARADISTRAAAVGRASKDIVAASGVCPQCEEVLLAFADAIEAMPVTAVAEVTINESVEFRGEPLTVRQVERVVESQVIVLLNEITADSRAAAAEGACVADAAPGSPPVLQIREDCNVAVSADDLLVDTEPITEAGVALRDLACDGSPNATVIDPVAVEFADAFSVAVTTVLTACDSGRGAAAIPCAVNMDTIASVVTQQAAAVLEGLDLAEYVSPECECDLVDAASEAELRVLLADSTVEALASVCPDGADFTSTADLEAALQDSVSRSIAALVLEVVSSEECGSRAATRASRARPSPADPDEWPGCADGMNTTGSCSKPENATVDAPGAAIGPDIIRATGDPVTPVTTNATAPVEAPSPVSTVRSDGNTTTVAADVGPDSGNRTMPMPAPTPAPAPAP